MHDVDCIGMDELDVARMQQSGIRGKAHRFPGPGLHFISSGLPKDKKAQLRLLLFVLLQLTP